MFERARALGVWAQGVRGDGAVAGCEDLMEPERAEGVHALLERLLPGVDACSCTLNEADMLDLYGVHESPRLLRAV